MGKFLKRFWWLVVLVIAGAGVGVFLLLRSNTASAQNTRQTALANAQTVKVTQGTISSIVSATGSVRTNQTATFGWQTSGRVGAVNVKVGDKVTQGQVLASLDLTTVSPSIVQAQANLAKDQKTLDSLQNSQVAKAQAELAVATAQQTLKDAQDNFYNLSGGRGNQTSIDAAQAQLTLAQNALDQAQKNFDLYSGRDPSDTAYANALSRLAAAKQSRDSAQRQVDWILGAPQSYEIAQAKANVDVAQAQLKDAQDKLARMTNGYDPVDLQVAQAAITADQATINTTQITAPFAGTITDVSTKLGDQVSTGTQAFRLDDMSKMLVDLQVSEIDISQIAVDQDVVLTFDAIQNKEYHGKVVEVGQVGATTSGTVYFTVTAQLQDADSTVKTGMTVSASITAASSQNALLVPNRAVRTNSSGGHTVIVERNGQPSPIQVQIGIVSDTQTEILAGDLKAGDLVVVIPTTSTGTTTGGNRGGFIPGVPGGGAFGR